MGDFQTLNNKIGFNKQFNYNINGISTEFVYHIFDNKWMLLITQLGKLPSLYNVTFDEQSDRRIIPYLNGPVDDPELHVSVNVSMKCSMGLDSDETRGGIQFLINKTSLYKCPNELLIGLGLKELKSEDLKAIAQLLEQHVFQEIEAN